MRDQFAVELGKIKPTRSGDPGGITYEPKWPHFKSLLFLRDVVKPRQSTGNLSNNSNLALKKTSDCREVQQELNDSENNFDETYNDENNQEIDETMNETARTNQALNNSEEILQFAEMGRKRKRNAMNLKYNETILEIEKKKANFLEAALSNRQQETDDMFFFAVFCLM